MTTFVPAVPLDAAALTAPDPPWWWHEEVGPGYHIPESGDFPHCEDKALREEEQR